MTVLEELKKEIKDSAGLADVIQHIMTPKLYPIDTKELGQNAFFVYSMLKKNEEKIQQLQNELDKAKNEIEYLQERSK
jgi:hypothetical protein